MRETSRAEQSGVGVGVGMGWDSRRQKDTPTPKEGLLKKWRALEWGDPSLCLRCAHPGLAGTGGPLGFCLPFAALLSVPLPLSGPSNGCKGAFATGSLLN